MIFNAGEEKFPVAWAFVMDCSQLQLNYRDQQI